MAGDGIAVKEVIVIRDGPKSPVSGGENCSAEINNGAPGAGHCGNFES